MARKINVKLILELNAAGVGRNKIAATRHIAKHSVSDVIKRSRELNILYNDVKDIDESEVYRIFYPEKHVTEYIYADPKYEYVHEELKKVGVTLKLLWEEYRDRCSQDKAIPMGYTKFCEGYSVFTSANKLTNHLEHKPGDCAEVDWSGPTISYCDPNTGEVITVYLFVGTLPYSQYSYVEPCLNMRMESFLRCHINMYEYFGGVPTRTVCDNLKTGVVKHPKDGDIVLTQDYEALGFHYMTAIMPTGVRKPKQKASVEGTVGKIATAIIAKLRNTVFYSFDDLKAAVRNKLKDFNNASFQKREGSRAIVHKEELPYLHPLPTLPYEIAFWVYNRKINLNFHVAYKKNFYSCPYKYATDEKKTVDLRVSDRTLEIYRGSERLTTHQLLPEYVTNRYSTHPEDMPPEFRNMKPWDDDRIRNWASSIGRNTREVIERIFQSVQIKEQAYNPCLSVLNLSKTYTDKRLETACELAIIRGIRSPRYHHLKGILSSNQDIVYLERKNTVPDEDSDLGYLRGYDYYKDGGDDDAE